MGTGVRPEPRSRDPAAINEGARGRFGKTFLLGAVTIFSEFWRSPLDWTLRFYRTLVRAQRPAPSTLASPSFALQIADGQSVVCRPSKWSESHKVLVVRMPERMIGSDAKMLVFWQDQASSLHQQPSTGVSILILLYCEC